LTFRPGVGYLLGAMATMQDSKERELAKILAKLRKAEERVAALSRERDELIHEIATTGRRGATSRMAKLMGVTKGRISQITTAAAPKKV
jgi:hypothetical protein